MLGAVLVSPDSLTPMVVKIAEQYNVEPALIKGIIKQESNWDVNASRYETKLGDSSWGLMQVLLATGKWILGNDKLTISDLVNPAVNVTAGTKYIAYLLNRFGNMRDAIAAYNAGSPKLGKDGKYINASYVDNVYRNYLMYKAMDVVTSPVGMSIGLGAVALVAIGLVMTNKR